jgi:YebC/PmpR family DNA-binding regulatory protein
MPKDNVDRAIKKAIGNDADSNFTEVRYEGYGPSGVAIIVETLTDNRNRTASEIRAAFSKHGGSLGETNSVAFSFEHCGYLRFSKDKDFDTIFENAIDVGAENVEATDEGIEVTCAVSDFAAVRDGLVDKIGDADESNLIWRPNNMAPINDFDSAKTLIKLIDILEDNDDVQNVYSNVDIATDVLAKLENG